MLVHHGEADRSVPLEAAKAMVEALKESGQHVELHTYPGADHAYHDDSHPQYHADASAVSWKRTLEFFGRFLNN
jgi:carboxymethylenebutenolidase